jgi:hypothetical protein
MKKYRLTDPKTLLGVLNKLQGIPVTLPGTEFKYIIEGAKVEKGLNLSTNINLTPLQDEMGKPDKLIAILKENKVELLIKQVNPFQNDLFDVIEILIEPLERSAPRAPIKNIAVEKIQLAETVDIATILSLYGKTSIITQTINSFQSHIENTLIQNNYFIKKVNVGFFYAATSPLLEHLSQLKTSYFLRDAHRKIFYTDKSFFKPDTKMQPREIDSMLNNLLLNNIKSVLIVPLFTTTNVILGYVEITSNMPNLGNDFLADEIDSPNGMSAVTSFLDSSAEDFIFNLELAYVKEWNQVAGKENIRDLSQDGRGIGIFFSGKDISDKYPTGSKVSFDIIINNQLYTFLGNLKGWKKPGSPGEMSILGLRIHSCNIANGIELLRAYSSKIILNEIK